MNKIQMNNWQWDLGRLPFVWSPLPHPVPEDGLPESLPFTLAEDAILGSFVQVLRPETQAALARVYQKGSQISGLMDDVGIGRQYAEDYLAFLKDALAAVNWQGLKVLELGSGTGYLLHRIQKLGAITLGVEPGAHGQQAISRFGLEIIHDFFPTPKVQSRFGLITFFAVLEHLEKPVDFLRSLLPYLNNTGRVALAVPNCQPAIEAGDLGMLLHEHWSYFTLNSLQNTVEAAGLEVEQIKTSGFGGALYCVCRVAQGPAKQPGRVAAESGRIFKSKVDKLTGKLVRYFEGAGRSGIGIFVPQRIINVAAMAKIPLEGCRFFDDNRNLQGTYFPGIPIPTESREALLCKPPPHLLIMSHSFGEKIASKLRPLLPRTRITTSANLLAEED